MKTVILGGSAHSTPALWSHIVNDARLDGLQIVLMGRDPRRLRAVAKACHLLANCVRNDLALELFDRSGWRCTKGADIVLIQIRNGGYAARIFDETFPLRFGICGDESLGPGGLSAGLRNWRAISSALTNIERYAPEAVILMMSAPVGLLVRAAKQRFPNLRIFGICELPWTTFLRICLKANLEPGTVNFDYAGVNHLGWLYGIRTGDYLVSDAVPLKYMRLHHDKENVLREQRANLHSRGAELEQISQLAFATYMNGNREKVLRCVNLRNTPWYEHAVGPAIAALAGRDIPISFFLSVPDEGFDATFENEDVLEYPHKVHRCEFERQPRRLPVPAHMADVIRQFVSYERLGATAILSGNVKDVTIALSHHPWVDAHVPIEEMAQEMANHAGCY